MQVSSAQVLDRVRTLLFSLHAVWRRTNKPIPGVFTTSTPPNILTLGYRLVRSSLLSHESPC